MKEDIAPFLLYRHCVTTQKFRLGCILIRPSFFHIRDTLNGNNRKRVYQVEGRKKKGKLTKGKERTG